MKTGTVAFSVGSSGWEHEAYDTCLYTTPGRESAAKLAEYSRSFDTVEVRSTFWDESLTPDDARQWVEAVAGNKRFTFILKLHSRFTHRKEITPALTRATRALLQTLDTHDRLGALLAQFPFSFTNTGANRYHLVKLGEIFRGFPVFVELRHASWDSPSILGFLEENNFHPVSADLPRVKQYIPFLTGVVGRHAYIRLHGRNEKGWLLNGLDARYDYLYNEREIREITRRLRILCEKCDRITVICNNTTHGKALVTAFQLTAAMKETRGLCIPATTLRQFPFLIPLTNQNTAEDLLLPVEHLREAV